MNSIWNIWNEHNEFKIPNTQFTLKGFSIAALRTNFYIKELNVMLDAGLSSPNVRMDNILITHAHADHVANLPFHLYASVNHSIIVHIPSMSFEHIKNFIESAYLMSTGQNLSGQNLCQKTLEGLYDVVSLNSVDETSTFNVFKNIDVKVIKCYHSIPTVGYGFRQYKNKLLDIYKDLPSTEVAKLCKSGTVVTERVADNFFCYLGDTDRRILENPDILNYRTIMIECTFLFDDDIDSADKTCHMHWKYLREFVLNHIDRYFVLYHFSQRYTKKEITQFFEDENLPNVYPWIS
jgi:ribonuclease Z